MSIQREFEKYGNEATFIRDFVVPLLRRLGYYIVHYHGRREYGRDLIFSEIDRLKNFVYHGLQAKYEGSIGQGESGSLIDDCREAFCHTFQHPITGEVGHISGFIVANAGSFADNTYERFHVDARNREHGGHVRLLDGKALLNLDRWATVARVEQVGETLSGLVREIQHNRSILACIVDTVKNSLANPATKLLPAWRLRVYAVSHYVQRPILTNIIPFEVVDAYLFDADTCVNRILDDVPLRKNGEELLTSTLLPAVGRLQAGADRIEAIIQTVLDTLGPLATA